MLTVTCAILSTGGTPGPDVELAAMMARLLGRLHPVIVHFPIALIILAGTAELLTALLSSRRRSMLAVQCVLVGAVAATIAAWGGWLFAQHDPPGRSVEETLLLHRWLGVAAATLACMAAILALLDSARPRDWARNGYRAMLLLAMASVGVTGHFGGEMVYGRGFIVEALRPMTGPPAFARERPPATAAVPAPARGEHGEIDFASQVQPILAERCYGCHGDRRGKGGLRLHVIEALFERDAADWVIVPGDAGASRLHQRIALPAEHPDRMPANGDPLTTEQVGIIRDWIDQGALGAAAPRPTDIALAPDEEAPSHAAPAAEDPGEALTFLLAEPDRADRDRALLSITERGGVALPVAESTDAVQVDLSRLDPPATDDDLALLHGLEPALVWLDLSRTAITDAGTGRLTGFTALRRLSLAGTSAGDESLRALAELPHLQHLNLVGTRITDVGLPAMADSIDLERLYVWQTRVTADGVDRLRRSRPGLEVVLGQDQLLPPPDESSDEVALLPACCAEARAAGGTCEHACCVAAAAEGRLCAMPDGPGHEMIPPPGRDPIMPSPPARSRCSIFDTERGARRGPSQSVLAAAVLWIAASSLAPSLASAAAPPADAPDAIRFGIEIRPILANHCFRCHGPDERARQANLRLDTAEGATSPRGSRPVVIVPGSPAASLLLRRVSTTDDEERMPPPEIGPALEAEQIDLLRRWIVEGAEYEPHWSFIPPRRPALPDVGDSGWARNPIDRFVLARLEREGLRPSAEADRHALIRRVSLDLTGLPPSPEAVEAFVRDQDPGAYEALVDRLLASPHYGERWARLWLDLARYADTKGYEADRRRTMWPYRDWVIRALNDDLPFDRFTLEQIAGDLLPDPSSAQRVATAFHRNTMTNDEGGTADEEFRVAAVVDRVNTTMQVWMGLTMNCAQCHAHKYDPFTHEEYFRLYAFFNQTADADRMDEAPLLAVPSPESAAALAALDGRIETAGRDVARIESELLDRQPQWERSQAANGRDATDRAGDAAAWLPLDGDLRDLARPGRAAEAHGGDAIFGHGVTGEALRLEASRHVELGDLGGFDRDEPFSFGAWLNPATDETMVPVARMNPARDHRGWDLFLHEGRAYVHLIHRWPDNTIRVNTRETIPPGRWRHVMVIYDGSGRASGVRITLDGRPAPLDITHDTLTGTIDADVPLNLGRREGERHFDGLIDDFRLYDRALDDEEIEAVVDEAIAAVIAIEPDRRSEAQRALLREVYLALSGGALAERRAELAELRRQRDERLAAVPSVPVMRELPEADHRRTHVHEGGSFLSPGREVRPGVPAVLHPLPADAAGSRLDLARWLVAEDNPLTARVVVNRHWEAFFGRGLVPTLEDFGTQGDLPSHSALLDWLAVELTARDWSLKALCRLIVTSATYRQSSRMTDEMLAIDPGNELLARGPRLRLEAEMIRDQALAVSGLLNREMFGPPVFPPQPGGVWQMVYSDDRWTTADDERRHRRALYTFWRRTSPYPSMITFDAPSRELCVSRRIRTNTPLQALVLLNDPAYVEAAQALARRALREAGPDARTRAAHVLGLCLGRPPRPGEVEALAALHAEALARYRDDRDAAVLLATDPLGPAPDDMEIADLAAWTVVANVVLNLDELLVKP